MNVSLQFVVMVWLCLASICQSNLAISFSEFLNRITTDDMSVVEQAITSDQDSLLNTALSYLVKSGDVEGVKSLLARHPLYQQPTQLYHELLMKAVNNGQLEIVHFLLLEMSEMFLDIRLARNEALKVAALYGKESIVKLLLQLPEDQRPTIQLDYVVPPAARKGHINVVKLLLKELPQEQRSDMQDRAMIQAAEHEQWCMTFSMLQYGANPRLLNPQQQLVMHAFLINSLQKALEPADWCEVERILNIASTGWVPESVQNQMRELMRPAIVEEIRAIISLWQGVLTIDLLERTLEFVIGPSAHLYYWQSIRPYMYS